MAYESAGVAEFNLEHVTALLSRNFGTPMRIVHYRPVTEGWSARAGMTAWPWIIRCAVESEDGSRASVIVKARRPEGHERGGTARLRTEGAALTFLQSIGSIAGPRLLVADYDAGLLVLEDLGLGSALEDLLTSGDAATGEHALLSFARALGQMHASTVGHAPEYYRLLGELGPVDSALDRISILGTDVRQAFDKLQAIVAARPGLPSLSGVEPDFDQILHILAEPGQLLAFSNGDTCSANCRLLDHKTRFIDFECAAFRHALLDVAALRFPFPACPCWSRVPGDVSGRAERVYREQVATSCPDVLNDASYLDGLAAACAAWTIVRAIRLPKLEVGDQPHPMGFSRCGQLLDTIATTITCADQSRSLASLTEWLTSVHEVLSDRWQLVTAEQPFYPAFRTSGPSPSDCV